MIIIIWVLPVPYTGYLYGDDISKKVSDIDSVNKVGRNVLRGISSCRFLRRRGGRARGIARIPLRDGQDRNFNRGEAAAPTVYKNSK